MARSRSPIRRFYRTLRTQSLAQSSQPCFRYFGKEDQQILDSPQIADHIVLMNVLHDILVSSNAPDIKEEMMSCARQRYEDARKGLNQMPAVQPTPVVPNNFAPSVSQTPMPFVPATAPAVRPMNNYAPNQMIQNGQTMMDSQRQKYAKPNKVSVVGYRMQQSRQTVFDETIRIITSEKYKLTVTDWPSGKIQAIGMTIDGGQVAAAVFISIQSTERGAFLHAVFAKYPGVVFGRSPKKLAANFEKDLRKVQPELIVEQ